MASGGLDNIVGWDTPENHGAEIYIFVPPGTQVNIGTGNIGISTALVAVIGGSFIAPGEFIKVLLSHGGTTVYVTDFL